MACKINIKIPSSNVAERQYIIDVLFGQILAIEYSVEIDDSYEDYLIEYKEQQIIINDSFFSSYPLEKSYLTIDALPQSVLFIQNEYLVEIDIPVIYGTGDFFINDKKIMCGIDIFASSFFMLTRWEEYVNHKRDIHGRFPTCESLAYRFDFMHRPIVNEYVEFLWNLLISIGYDQVRGKRFYQLNLTHDVDLISYRRGKYIALAGDLVKRWSIGTAFKRLDYLFFHNPYNTFDFLMDQSEKTGIQSHFYFMALTRPVCRNAYEGESYIDTNEFAHIVDKINRRGHIIGFHPGYMTYMNEFEWKRQKQKLENVVEQNILEGRQHFLQFDISQTFSIWAKNGMETDSSLGYVDHAGFRCGTGDSFFVFDINDRKKLNIKECPLVIMEGALNSYGNHSLEDIETIYERYIRCCQKYKMMFTILFHNTSFDAISWPGWKQLYEKILRIGSY